MLLASTVDGCYPNHQGLILLSPGLWSGPGKHTKAEIVASVGGVPTIRV